MSGFRRRHVGSLLLQTIVSSLRNLKAQPKNVVPKSMATVTGTLPGELSRIFPSISPANLLPALRGRPVFSSLKSQWMDLSSFKSSLLLKNWCRFYSLWTTEHRWIAQQFISGVLVVQICNKYLVKLISMKPVISLWLEEWTCNAESAHQNISVTKCLQSKANISTYYIRKHVSTYNSIEHNMFRYRVCKDAREIISCAWTKLNPFCLCLQS